MIIAADVLLVFENPSVAQLAQSDPVFFKCRLLHVPFNTDFVPPPTKKQTNMQQDLKNQSFMCNLIPIVPVDKPSPI